MSIVEFQLDPDQGKLTGGFPIPRGSVLYSRPVNGVPCQFRTCYDTTLWPLSVTSAEWLGPERLPPGVRFPDTAAAVRIRLQSPPGVPIPQVRLDTLRFYLDGDSATVHSLYELLCCRLLRVVVRAPSNQGTPAVAILPGGSLRPVGYEAGEGMFDYSLRSFLGYRLLQEYFAFPEKFFFVDLPSLEPAWHTAGVQEAADVYFLLSSTGGEERRQRLELSVSDSMFRLGCAPVVNLFQQTAEPILLHQRSYEYPVIPDVRRQQAMEVYSIDEVVSAASDSDRVIRYVPFYAPRSAAMEKAQQFYVAARRPSARANDAGTDIYISLVDASLRPLDPGRDTLTVRTTCTNRDLPARLPFGNPAGDFEFEGNAPLKKISALKKPTVPFRGPRGRTTLWHLISHFSLNYLSLAEDGKESLQHILRMYDFTGTAFTQRTVDGIVAVRSQPHFARLLSEHGVTFVRGRRVELELDEEQFVGGGVYLFASVIERFLSLYASLNSFTQLSARVRQRKEVMREWPPRAGQRILM
jgi:type VI secretion system protein ImpG